ncbi:MAG: DMT family transporter [Desulfobacterales bacterium]
MTASRSTSGGAIWILLAPLFYAGMSTSAKLAGAYLSVWQIGVGRFIFGLLVVPIIVRALRLDLWGRQRFLLMLRGLCGSASFLMLVAAFQRIPLSLAMVLFYLYPAFTTLLSPWITGEPPPKSAWFFIGCAFAGTSLILWPHEASGNLNSGHLLAVIASILCAITLLLVRRLGKNNNIYTLFFYLCITGTLAGTAPLIMQGNSPLPNSAAAWICIGAVALFSIAAQLTLNQALVRIPAATVSIMMTIEVPLVAAFGVLYLGEPAGWRLIIGALLIFGSGIGLNLVPASSAGGLEAGRQRGESSKLKAERLKLKGKEKSRRRRVLG